MPDLIAQGTDPANRWRRTLEAKKDYELGRASLFAVSWDPQISRYHATVRLDGNRLSVKKNTDAGNPVFYNGQSKDSFTIKAGEHFVIGSTTFVLSVEQINVTQDAPSPMAEEVYRPQYLRKLRYRDPDKRIKVLGQLPDIIRTANSDDEMFVQLVNVLLSGIERAAAIAIVSVGSPSSEAEQSIKNPSSTSQPVEVFHWDRRRMVSSDFQPSESLIRQAISTEQSILHIWRAEEGSRPAYTFSEEGDWAFSTPILSKACGGWAIYAAGDFSSDSAGTPSGEDVEANDFRDDIKFAELVATTVANLKEMTLLEKNQASLGQFFSPVVMAALSGQDPEQVLSPRESNVSILFCDLRGFSKTSEEHSDDLLGLLNRVSQALGVTTHHIFQQEGVIGDFHGDASMGFWGWPIQQSDSLLRSCLAALGIRRELSLSSQVPDHPLRNFSMGIGIATGRAVAGKIGTVDQVKVTAFGPVVNLAARLETMTKQLRAKILLDETTAIFIREEVDPSIARIRKVARVQPFGLQTPLVVSELLPPLDEYPQLNDDHIAAYEEALDFLLAGDWEQSFKLLHQVPADDEVKDFLTVLIAQHNRKCPADWEGVIPLLSK